MKRRDAIDIYNAGQEVVVENLCNMSDEISRLKKELQEKDLKIASLSKNSTNSSKKPSSDDVTKPKAGKEGDKKRKIGGQPGHPMHRRPLAPKEQIDTFHEYKLVGCPGCGSEAKFIDLEPRRIQQIELKEIVTETHEHLSYPIWCESCKEVHYAPFPPEIVKEGLFKARITATVAYMCKVCHASFSTMRKFFRDIIGSRFQGVTWLKL